MQDTYKNIEEYNLDRKRQILIVFNDMIDNMINNKKLNDVVTDLLIRSREINIFLVFIKQFIF